MNRYIGGPVWCARRWDGTGRVLNAGSPEHLVEYLEEGGGAVILADIALLVEALPLVAFIVAIPVLPPPRWPGKP